MKKYSGPQTVEAELFDGTAEQAKKCGLKYGIIDLIYTSNGYKPLWGWVLHYEIIKPGQWYVVNDENGKYQPMKINDFLKTYEEVEA